MSKGLEALNKIRFLIDFIQLNDEKTAYYLNTIENELKRLKKQDDILRIIKRLKLANKDDDAYQTEMKLKKSFDEAHWIKIHHQLIHFGRDICLARNPKCEKCKLIEICKEFKSN